MSYQTREASCGVRLICNATVAKLWLPSLTHLSNISFIHIGLGDDAPSEIKKPRKPSIFDIGNVIPARSIVTIICGGMHSVALASNGAVYTWGCNGGCCILGHVSLYMVRHLINMSVRWLSSLA